MKASLVVMAAGIGSRFGGGIKQLTSVGPDGEVIMDYAIYDAIRAGFNKVVFIIRKDLREQFRDIVGRRVEGLCETEYVYQELSDIPAGYSVPEGRTKPWGTAHAVYCCRDAVKEPFLVLNADDYYGTSTFGVMYDFLKGAQGSSGKYCMPGFELKNTLSENGTVTRGICRANDAGELASIVETYGVQHSPDGAISDRDGKKYSGDEIASMNMWGLTPDFIDILAGDFERFLSEEASEKADAEWLLPNVIADLIKSGRASVSVRPVSERWFGVTYKEDKEAVQEQFIKMHGNGTYPGRMNGL